MANTEETERWIQCAKCAKWRVIPDENVVRVGDGPWECRLNVFSTTHNQCSAPQEAMPVAAAPLRTRTASEETTALLQGMGLEIVEEESAEALFTPSACTCATCREMNEAARQWHNIERQPHHVPLIACVMRTIAATAQIATRMEEEKRFCYAPVDPEVPSLS